MSYGETETFQATCLRETENAILVDIDGSEYWIPKSQVDDASEVWLEGDQGDLVITQWVAEKKGLI